MAITAAVGTGAGYVTIPEAVRYFYSKEVLFLAQPRLRFLQFAKIKEDLTALRGKGIVFVKYENLEGGGQLEEDEVLVPKGLGTSEIVINVKEQGNAVQVTEYVLKTSLLDVLGDASRLLATNMAKVLDGQFRDAVLATTNIILGGQGTLTPPAVIEDLAVGDGLDAATIKDTVEHLATNNSPRFNGEYYVCFAHPHQLRQLRDDSEWIEANKYMGRRQLYLGEVGMFNGVIFIETTQMPANTIAQTIAKYSTADGPATYEAVIFGENAFAWAVALPVELRDDGVVDMGRKHTLGWYGIWGTGLLEEKNVFKVITA